MLRTISLDLPLLLPQNPDCDCCVGHLVDSLRAQEGVAAARREAGQIVLAVDPGVAEAEAERLARDAGAHVERRYDHSTLAIAGMDCADCARTIERALTRHDGVHYAVVNFAAASVRLEYDRERTSIDAIRALVGRIGYSLAIPMGAFSCSVAGMCCASEALHIPATLQLNAPIGRADRLLARHTNGRVQLQRGGDVLRV